MKELKIKPMKELQLGYALWIIGVFTILIEVMGAIFSRNWYEFLLGNVVLVGIVLLTFMVYFTIRIFYRSYFIFTENEVVKYKREKIVFKINREQIVGLKYRKRTFAMFLFTPLGYIFGDSMCGIVSIRYYSAEVESDRIFESGGKIEMLTEEEKLSGIKEYCEAFSKRDLKKITQMLNISVGKI